MSADGSVTLAWAGEERKFRLAIGQLRELQENVNRWRVNIGAVPIGPSSLLRLLMGGDAWPDEVREIVRLGLIGGGEVSIALVPGLIKRYVDDRPLVESTQVAQAVLLSAMVGVPDDPVGKKPKRRRKTRATSSASPASTEQDAQSDSLQTRSTACPSGSSLPVSTGSTGPMAESPNPTQ
jgi:hypothetical protein